ncbi:carboxymuconolactone decarboxylase [Actinoplanes cyaneus]|uniref:Carboxymuconolactone decarboxylase n=2 Tax=Actinoplanes cyaneus TaxID=52696 RepID=A0A919M1C5_9ACTN|nr:carboxymuconolactone decarboxylase [Actinoplanes cyaneus]
MAERPHRHACLPGDGYLDAMAYIDLGVDERALPGIQGLLKYRPETAAPLMALAETLLRGPNSLTPGERELIAAHVSALNECDFCRDSHAAAAAAQLPEGMALVEQVRADPSSAPVAAKLRALLRIAEAVRRDGRDVTESLVADARSVGATDPEIHDTVLIAAAFAMFNRYVDGLGTRTPDDPRAYELSAKRITTSGYQNRS